MQCIFKLVFLCPFVPCAKLENIAIKAMNQVPKLENNVPFVVTCPCGDDCPSSIKKMNLIFYIVFASSLQNIIFFKVFFQSS
jgi:hypothetical protein